jgi:hypothetical protein
MVPPCGGLDVQPAMRAIRIRNAILIPPKNVRDFMEKTPLEPHTIPEYLWVFSLPRYRRILMGRTAMYRGPHHEKCAGNYPELRWGRAKIIICPPLTPCA